MSTLYSKERLLDEQGLYTKVDENTVFSDAIDALGERRGLQDVARRDGKRQKNPDYKVGCPINDDKDS